MYHPDIKLIAKVKLGVVKALDGYLVHPRSFDGIDIERDLVEYRTLVGPHGKVQVLFKAYPAKPNTVRYKLYFSLPDRLKGQSLCKAMAKDYRHVFRQLASSPICSHRDGTVKDYWLNLLDEVLMAYWLEAITLGSLEEVLMGIEEEAPVVI